MNILDATEDDLPAILAIYNEAVANTTAIWNETIVDLANRSHWLSQRREQGYPVLVVHDGDGHAIGFASFGDWRAWDGYRFTVEHSVYVHQKHRGKGVASLLLTALAERARDAGKHMMIAGIEGSNEASMRLHARQGFVEAGRMREVGTKFGRWLDLVFMQLALDDRSDPGAEP